MKSKINKQNIFLIILLLILIFIILGISYAFLQTSFFATKDSVLKVGSLSLVLDESEGNAITVSADGPLSDSEGVNLDNYYSFKLTNNGKVASSYTIYLDNQPLDEGDVRIDQKYVHYSLERDDSNNVAKSLTGEQKLESGIINSKQTINYKLRLWFSSDMTAEEENKVFKAKLRIEGASTSEESLNKKCQDAGGNYYIDGECRKYYVMKNNFVKDVNFSNGSIDWILNANAFFEDTNNNIATINCSKKTSNSCGIYQRPILSSTYNHIYYVSQSIKSDSSNMKFDILIEQISTIFNDIIGDNNWHRFSSVFKYDDNVKEIVAGGRQYAYVIYATNEFNSNFYVKNPVYVDLTLMFGEGNEPSKEWCDKHLTDYIEYSESGIKTPISDINYTGKTSYYDVIDIS